MKSKAPNYPIRGALEYLGHDAPHLGGNGYAWMRCPFHDDGKPSAHISEFGFQCFVCGESGDAIKLLKRHGGLNYQAAIAVLEERTDGQDRERAPERPFGQSLLG